MSSEITERFAVFLEDLKDGSWEYGDGTAMQDDAISAVNYIQQLQQQIDVLKAQVNELTWVLRYRILGWRENEDCQRDNVVGYIEHEASKALDKSLEQSLEEHDKAVHDAGYNKAIEDVLALDHDCVGYKLTIRRLSKQPGWCYGCNPDNCSGGCGNGE